MEPWARELLEVWGEKIPEIVEVSMSSIGRMYVGKYGPEDIAQMIRGARAMMTEELEQRTSTLREDYFESLVPALAAQGERTSTMAGVDIAVCIRIAVSVLPALSPENRGAAADFFVDWQSRFLREIVVTAVAAGAQP